MQPFDAKKPDDVTPWRNNGRGLKLEVLNALDDNWDEFFYRAILDWDTGYPDALTLSTATADKDSVCNEIPVSLSQFFDIRNHIGKSPSHRQKLRRVKSKFATQITEQHPGRGSTRYILTGVVTFTPVRHD